MQLNLSSFLLLNRKVRASREQKQSKKNLVAGSTPDQDSLHNELSDADESGSSAKQAVTRRQRFADWMSPKPEPIKLFTGETELFRKGLVLVTDKRLAYIDPFDRMLKTYMFEHMISMHKQFYRTSNLNRRLCKGLLIISLLVFLVILTIDLLDSNSRIFFLVYIPVLASTFIGIKVWKDIKPRYVIHWRMRDLSYDEIVQEPMLRERVLGSNKREVFMNELANAMNQALSMNTSMPDRQYQLPGMQAAIDTNSASDANVSTDTPNDKPKLTLVTENYQ